VGKKCLKRNLDDLPSKKGSELGNSSPQKKAKGKERRLAFWEDISWERKNGGGEEVQMSGGLRGKAGKHRNLLPPETILLVGG